MINNKIHAAVSLGFFGWYPYKKIDPITNVAPITNCNDN